MTIQPTFNFARNDREVFGEDADRQHEETGSDGEKNVHPATDRTPSVSSFNSDEKQTFGVSKVEAITTVWSKRALITLYVFIFLVYFVNSMQQQTTGQFLPYVTSAFSSHSLIPVIGIVSNITTGVMKPPLAKILDVFGRFEGLFISLLLSILGLVLMASCTSVEIYAAATIFYWLGYNGMFFTLEIIIADSSSLPNRVLMFAFATSPFIINVWTGPDIAQSFFNHYPPTQTTLGWRWGHGIWAIILPVVTAPILAVLFVNQRKAKRMGIYPESPMHNKSIWQFLKELFFELDISGLILITAGFALVLLAITLAGDQSEKWREARIIVMLVIGFCCLVAACVWEYRFAVYPLLRWNLIKDRTVACACGIGFLFWVTFYCWDGYYTSFLQVVHFRSVRAAGYIANTYSFGSCITGIILGVIIKFHGKYKIWAIIGVPIYILGTGLMIHFRGPQFNQGYLIMCQIFVAIGGGTMSFLTQLAVMSVVSHQDTAAVLAILGTITSIGGAVGLAISGSIWTNVLPEQLAQNLPPSIHNESATIFGSLTNQTQWPRGSPERNGIIVSYAYTQKVLCLAATCISTGALILVFGLKDVKLKEVRQPVKGLVV